MFEEALALQGLPDEVQLMILDKRAICCLRDFYTQPCRDPSEFINDSIQLATSAQNRYGLD